MFNVVNHKKSRNNVNEDLVSAYSYNLSNRLVFCDRDILENHIYSRLHVYDLNRFFRTCIVTTTLGFKSTYLSQRKVEMEEKKQRIMKFITYIADMDVLSVLDERFFNIMNLYEKHLCLSSVLKYQDYSCALDLLEGLSLLFGSESIVITQTVIDIFQEISLIDKLEIKKQFIFLLIYVNKIAINDMIWGVDLFQSFLEKLEYDLSSYSFNSNQIEYADKISDVNIDHKSHKSRKSTCIVS